MTEKGELTILLMEVNQGNVTAYNKIFPIIYNELRHITNRIGFACDALETLDTTAVLHEAYLKILNSETSWLSRAHFYGIASKAIRSILLNAANRRIAIQKAQEEQQIYFDVWQEKMKLSNECAQELIFLDQILKNIDSQSPRSRIVECIFFARMNIEETAAVLEMTPKQVKSDWRSTKDWVMELLNSRRIA